MDEISDQLCFSILRNVNILYDVNDHFRSDIDEQVYAELDKRKSYVDFQRTVRLSIHYLLEEIAANIRMKVAEKIEDEYYLGDQMRILPKLYRGDYGVRVHDLAGVAPLAMHFRFFNWHEREALPFGEWELYEPGD
jgi:hypothetical protein